MNYYLHLLYIRRFLSFKKNISIGNNIDDVIDAIDTIFVIKNPIIVATPFPTFKSKHYWICVSYNNTKCRYCNKIFNTYTCICYFMYYIC